MKKFKLIKKYPGSPKLGLEIHDNGPFWESDFAIKSVELFHINNIIFQPENYPEFWEEVVEKDYEILSFKSISKNSNNKLSTRLSNGKHSWLSDLNPKENKESILIDNKNYIIVSVKRLSDGEI